MLFAALTLWGARNYMRYSAKLRSYSRISPWRSRRISGTKKPGCFQPGFFVSRLVGREDSHTTYKQLKLNNYPQYHQPIYPHKYPQFAPAGPLIGAIPSIWRRLISAGPIISRAARRAIWPAHPCRTSLYDTSYSASLHPIGSAGRHFSIYQQGAS